MKIQKTFIVSITSATGRCEPNEPHTMHVLVTITGQIQRPPEPNCWAPLILTVSRYISGHRLTLRTTRCTCEYEEGFRKMHTGWSKRLLHRRIPCIMYGNIHQGQGHFLLENLSSLLQENNVATSFIVDSGRSCKRDPNRLDHTSLEMFEDVIIAVLPCRRAVPTEAALQVLHRHC
jgi:hypothetical protein